jgi:hypothetical protein
MRKIPKSAKSEREEHPPLMIGWEEFSGSLLKVEKTFEHDTAEVLRTWDWIRGTSKGRQLALTNSARKKQPLLRVQRKSDENFAG